MDSLGTSYPAAILASSPAPAGHCGLFKATEKYQFAEQIPFLVTWAQEQQKKGRFLFREYQSFFLIVIDTQNSWEQSLGHFANDIIEVLPPHPANYRFYLLALLLDPTEAVLARQHLDKLQLLSAAEADLAWYTR